MLGRKRSILIIAAVLVVIVSLYFWRRLSDSYVPVKVAQAQQGNLVQTFRTNGVVEPVRFAEVRAEFSSPVLETRVQDAERVERGQLLARLDNREMRALVAQARTRWLEAKRELERVRSAGALKELEAQIAQARADLRLAASQHDRSQKLIQQRAISQAEYDAAVAEFDKQTQRLAALEQEQAVQVRKLVPLAVEEAQARVEQARVELANAEVKLGSAEVRAPMKGTVLQKPPRAGTLVNPGDLLARVGDLEHLQVRAYVDQPDFSTIRVGSPVKITSTGFPGEVWEGKVITLSAELSTIGKRVVGEAICEITSNPHTLPVNSNVDLTFTSRELRDVLLVPVEAVSQRDGRSYVYVVNGNHLRRREVQVGASNPDYIVVRSGLAPNERVLTDLEVRPTEGMKVIPH